MTQKKNSSVDRGHLFPINRAKPATDKQMEEMSVSPKKTSYHTFVGLCGPDTRAVRVVERKDRKKIKRFTTFSTLPSNIKLFFLDEI